MNFERILASSVCLIAVLLGACSFSTETGETVQESAIEAPDMDAYWAAHAAHRQSGDLEAATSILAEGCVLFEPFRPPVSGRETITARLKEALAMAEIHEAGRAQRNDPDRPTSYSAAEVRARHRRAQHSTWPASAPILGR